jgi:tRNA dimethylallyltransferase
VSGARGDPADSGAAGPLLFLVGATASGKKQAALAAADELPVELVALDSMKVYRGLDVGTDKLAAQRFALVDLVEPSERFSVGAYVRAAQTAVAAIRARRRLPLFVGGTGLYLRALVRGLFEVPDVAPEVRAQVQAELDELGTPAVHARLAQVDAASAARLHVNDRKRVARALEVFRQTGRTLAEWQATATRRPIDGRAVIVGIRWPRAALARRIEVRVERMFERGLVDEVRALVATRRLGPVAELAIGVREVVAMDRDGTSLDECRHAVVRDTKTFVRRQENWFRQFPEITWIDAQPDEEEVAQRVVAAFRTRIV